MLELRHESDLIHPNASHRMGSGEPISRNAALCRLGIITHVIMLESVYLGYVIESGGGVEEMRRGEIFKTI